MDDKNTPVRARVVQEHESGVRRLVAEAHGQPYRAVSSLAEAREHEDAVVILDGDWGGQVYVVVPVRLVKCTEQTLRQLLMDIDSVEWKEPEGAGVYFELRPPGSPIPGGMGGATLLEGIWVHPSLKAYRIWIAAVLAGQRERLRQ